MEINSEFNNIQPKAHTFLLMPFMFLFMLLLTFLLFVCLPSSDKSLTTYVNIIQNSTIPFYFLFFNIILSLFHTCSFCVPCLHIKRLRECLACAFPGVLLRPRFLLFFFFFLHVNSNHTWVYCSRTVHALFIHCLALFIYCSHIKKY